MFVASWNEKGELYNTETTTAYTPLELTQNGTPGYYINGANSAKISTTNSLYIWSLEENSGIWLAAPHATGGFALMCAWPAGTVGHSQRTVDFFRSSSSGLF